MKKYRVLVRVTETYAVDVEATSPEGARKVAEFKPYLLGDKLGPHTVAYEVVDNEFDTTN